MKTVRKKRQVRKREKVVKRSAAGKRISDLDILELIIREFLRELKKSGKEVEVRDLIKVLQIKQKLAPQGEGEKIFWQLIDELRDEELGKMYKKVGVIKGEEGGIIK